MWDKLKEKLQGNDEESRSKLLTKFMTMKKGDDLNIKQFANKLKRIQGLLNGNTTFITDKMVIGQIFANAGPSLEYLTNNLRTTPNLELKDVLKRYELAEESKELNDLEEKHNDTVAALYAQKGKKPVKYNNQQQQNPGKVTLPTCPSDWNGCDCWYHSPPTHKAVDCDGLKVFQIRYLNANSIAFKDAVQLRGYPVPGSLPRPLTNNQNS